MEKNIKFKISPNWGSKITLDELIAESKFIFIQEGKSLLPRIVIATPIEGINCFEIDYDRYGLTVGGLSFFNHEWGKTIKDSSKDCVGFLKQFLQDEGISEFIIEPTNRKK